LQPLPQPLLQEEFWGSPSSTSCRLTEKGNVAAKANRAGLMFMKSPVIFCYLNDSDIAFVTAAAIARRVLRITLFNILPADRKGQRRCESH
jgi:hypothetical protein